MAQECIVCGRPYPEEHHIVFRGQQAAMINCPHNKIGLCYECHKGKSGPHMNKALDINYKLQLQEKLYELFGDKDIYTEEEVKKILQIPKKHAWMLTKALPLRVRESVAGYMKEDIIRQAMGGRLYG